MNRWIQMGAAAIATGTAIVQAFGDGFGRSVTITFTKGSLYAEIVDESSVALGAGAILLDPLLIFTLAAGTAIVAFFDTKPAAASEPSGAPVTYTAGPYDRKFISLTFGGLLPGNETWVCSIHLADPVSSASDASAAVDAVDLDAALSDNQDAVKNYFVSPALNISNAVWLTFAKMSRCGTDGKLEAPVAGQQNPIEHVYPTGTVGGATASNIHPNQISLAVSLTTGYARGPAHRGRFYLPLPNFVVTDGSIGAGNAAGLATISAAFIASLAAGPLVPVVMSRKAGAPATNAITGVQVGQALDTQQRRRRKVSEGYQAHAL